MREEDDPAGFSFFLSILPFLLTAGMSLQSHFHSGTLIPLQARQPTLGTRQARQDLRVDLGEFPLLPSSQPSISEPPLACVLFLSARAVPAGFDIQKARSVSDGVRRMTHLRVNVKSNSSDLFSILRYF